MHTYVNTCILREAAKKLWFFSCPTTKRGGGGKAWPLRKNTVFYMVLWWCGNSKHPARRCIRHPEIHPFLKIVREFVWVKQWWIDRFFEALKKFGEFFVGYYIKWVTTSVHIIIKKSRVVSFWERRDIDIAENIYSCLKRRKYVCLNYDKLSDVECDCVFTTGSARYHFF